MVFSTMRQMTWLALLNYIAANWRPFIVVATLTVAGGALVPLWLLSKDAIRNILVSQSQVVYFSVVPLTISVLVLAWPRAAAFWPRYRRTLALDRPPVQHIDLIATGILAGLLTAISLVRLGFFEFSVSTPVRFSVLAATLLFLFWCFGSMFWSPKAIPTKGSSRDRRQHEGDYNDDPILHDEDDLFGRIVFVDRLLEQIIKLPSPNSFVFGLYGSWGEGKTSVLNLLQGRLTKLPDVITIYFNPWYFVDEMALIQGFYHRVDQELESLYILPGFHRTITRYKNVLTSALQYFGAQFPLKDDPDKLRRELETWFERIGSRIIIIIDDIDRLQADEMLAVLKLTRLSARLRNTVFLLSLDNHIVLHTLENHSKLEPEFLDKIIQKAVPLPPAEQRDIDRFLLFSDPQGPNAHRSAIDHLLDELQIQPERRREFDDKFAFLYHTVVRRLFWTMRHAKRYMNTLRATIPSIGNEINLFDFFLLEVLQVFFPNVYKDIWSNPWFYLPSWSQDVILIYPFALIANEDEKYRVKREHIDKLIAGEPQKEIVQRILEELFFIEVKNAFQQHGRMTHDSMKESYLVERRLTHPKCFPRYFLFRVPTGEFADEAIERLIDSWNSAEDPEIVAYRSLCQYKEAGQIPPVLEKLRIFRRLISAKQVAALVRAICRIASELSDTAIELWDTERYRAQRFLLSLIEDCADPQEVEPIVQDVVRKVNSFPFLVSFVYECARNTSGDYFHIYEKVNIVSLRRLASERLSKHFIQGKRDIFADHSEADAAHVLYYWATTWRTDAKDNRTIVQNYVLDLIDHKPEYLGALLSGFTSTHISASGKHSTFDYEGFKRAFDPVVFHGRLLQHGDAAVTTPAARDFASVFLERFDAENAKQ